MFYACFECAFVLCADFCTDQPYDKLHQFDVGAVQYKSVLRPSHCKRCGSHWLQPLWRPCSVHVEVDGVLSPPAPLVLAASPCLEYIFSVIAWLTRVLIAEDSDLCKNSCGSTLVNGAAGPRALLHFSPRQHRHGIQEPQRSMRVSNVLLFCVPTSAQTNNSTRSISSMWGPFSINPCCVRRIAKVWISLAATIVAALFRAR